MIRNGVKLLCVKALFIFLWASSIQQFFPVVAETELAYVKESKLTPLPAPSIKSLLDRTFQRSMEKWHGENFGFRNHMLKTYNQLYYWLFEQSPYQVFLERDKTIVGVNGELIARKHVYNYLQIEKPIDEGVTDSNAARLSKIQRLLEQRGIPFIMVITPTKPSLYPEYIPPRFRGIGKYKENANYHILKEALVRHGVNLVDSFDILAREEAKGSPPMFTKGGFHWNRYGQYFPAVEILERIEKAGKPLPRKPELIDVEIGVPKKEAKVETELVDMLNLWSFDVDYPCPRPVVKINELDPAGKMRVLFVGGSFLSEMTYLYSNNSIFDEFTLLFYYDLELRFIRNVGWPKVYAPVKRLDWQNDVFKNDAVIYEVNHFSIKEDFSEWGKGFLMDIEMVLENKTGPTKH